VPRRAGRAAVTGGRRRSRAHAGIDSPVVAADAVAPLAAPTPSPSCGPRAPRDLSAAALVAWLVAITAAAAALRLRHLGIQILGDDELHMLAAVTTRTLAELPETVRGNDFGIPLAMAYRAWSAWRPLDEWTLRAPMLACGVAAPALAVLLARRLVSARVALFLGMLLAVHPLFIFYSRYVRPYAVCLVLLLGATWLIDRWATERRRALLAGAACCSALACWCQPLAVIAVALLFGGALLAELLPCRSAAGPSPAEAPVPAAPRRPLAVVLGGTLALLLSLALFAPALPDLYRQFIVGKVGRGALDAEAVRRNAAVLAGLPGTVPALVFAALALAGAALLARRSGRRALLLVVPAVGQPLVILALQPAQLGGTLVLARYQFYVLPFWLLFAALALAWLARRAAGAFAAISARAGRSRAFPAGGPLLAAAFAAALWWWGPCRDIYTADNACAHHDVFQTFATSTRSCPRPARRWWWSGRRRRTSRTTCSISRRPSTAGR